MCSWNTWWKIQFKSQKSSWCPSFLKYRLSPVLFILWIPFQSRDLTRWTQLTLSFILCLQKVIKTARDRRWVGRWYFKTVVRIINWDYHLMRGAESTYTREGGRQSINQELRHYEHLGPIFCASTTTYWGQNQPKVFTKYPSSIKKCCA